MITLYNTNDKQRNRFEEFANIKDHGNVMNSPVISIESVVKGNRTFGDKKRIIRAIETNDIKTLRSLSRYYFRTCGIYSRICRYVANFYRYDWYVTPYLYTEKYKKKKNDVVLKEFWASLKKLDNFYLKKYCQDTALDVIVDGEYYGYKNDTKDKLTIQELPLNYCRTRFKDGSADIVEFNMSYFDDNFKSDAERNFIFKVFPPEFKKGYNLYKKGKLPPSFQGDTAGWYLLSTKNAFRIALNGLGYPPFVTMIPYILDLEKAQELDNLKKEQELIKLLIQKFPIDKNGDPVLDDVEMKTLHENGKRMLQEVIGVKLFSTLADVSVEDMFDSRTNTGDNLETNERSVFNEAGIAQNLFNTDGNLALEKSINNDGALLYNIVLQFQMLFSSTLEVYNRKRKDFEFKFFFLPTTVYNDKDLSKLFENQAKMGYGKMLPQLSLGLSQSDILMTAEFENNVLELYKNFIPLMNSNTMNSNDILEEGGGRPELDDDKKSEKTIKNIESMS